jgi:hypothetical protein
MQVLLKLPFWSQHAAAVLLQGTGLIKQLHGMHQVKHMNNYGVYALCRSAPSLFSFSPADCLRELIAGQIQVHQICQATKCCADRP